MLRRTLSVSTLIGAILLAVSQAWAQGEVLQHNFRWCGAEDPDYEYALCAASTCTALPGVEIAVNTAGGGTANFPAAQCTCPIFKGLALADVNGGNMTGSCVPSPNYGMWTLYIHPVNNSQTLNHRSRGETLSG